MADKKPTYKKRSKRSYVEAAKRAAATRRKNSRAPAKRSSTTAKKTRRRKSTAKPKGMLSELFNPKMAEAGGRALMSGAVGGIAVGGIDKFMANQTPIVRNITKFAGSFLAATVFKAPHLGAGMAGATINNLMQENGMLAEDNQYLQEHQYSTGIEQLPMVLNEDGSTMYLEEGDDMYLEEGEEDEYSYDVGYFPQFGM